MAVSRRRRASLTLMRLVVCRLRGHEQGVWFDGHVPEAGGKREQVMACPRCRVILDVRPGGPRKLRRQKQREDWRGKSNT
jgi:hypothetical protein